MGNGPYGRATLNPLDCATMKTDMQTVAYILGRIRALPAKMQARWRESNRTRLRRDAKRIVIAQWVAEIPGCS